MKYAALGAYLAAQKAERLAMSFDEVAEAAKVRLPASAYRYAQWWENDLIHHVQAKAWLGAGYRAESVNLAERRVEFVRVRNAAPGVSEMTQTFDHKPNQVDVHPAFGALKGSFTIDPAWDVTKPALDEDELAEWEASLDRKADRIEAGLRRGK